MSDKTRKLEELFIQCVNSSIDLKNFIGLITEDSTELDEFVVTALEYNFSITSSFRNLSTMMDWLPSFLLYKKEFLNEGHSTSEWIGLRPVEAIHYIRKTAKTMSLTDAKRVYDYFRGE